jgi:hypothetical protein
MYQLLISCKPGVPLAFPVTIQGLLAGLQPLTSVKAAPTAAGTPTPAPHVVLVAVLLAQARERSHLPPTASKVLQKPLFEDARPAQ